MEIKFKYMIAGAAAGIINGFFGSGGGMILIPLLTSWIKMDEKKAFTTSVSIILPLCVVSSIVYVSRTDITFSMTLPYLIGGLVGGSIGGILFKNTSVGFLRRIFALFVIWGGIRALI